MRISLSIKPVAAVLAATFLLIACVNKAAQYQRYEARQVQAGKFRTDTDPADAPVTKEILKENFQKVALFKEFNENQEKDRIATPLKRWEQPIRYAFFGSGVTAEDRRHMRILALRLSELTGRKIEPIRKDANLAIFYLNDEERGPVLEELTEKIGEERAAFPRKWANSDNLPCVGQIYYDKSGRIKRGLVYIKNEISGLYRQSCLHEEIVQSMGLTNDDLDVRPSIFNDDGEFALMTRHDEYLLQILYSDQMAPGLTLEQVEPLLSDVVEEIFARQAR